MQRVDVPRRHVQSAVGGHTPPRNPSVPFSSRKKCSVLSVGFLLPWGDPFQTLRTRRRRRTKEPGQSIEKMTLAHGVGSTPHARISNPSSTHTNPWGDGDQRIPRPMDRASTRPSQPSLAHREERVKWTKGLPSSEKANGRERTEGRREGGNLMRPP